MYRYYVTQRAPSPGAVPNSKGNPIVEVKAYSVKKRITGFDCGVYGYVEYAEPLTGKEIDDYELVEG